MRRHTPLWSALASVCWFLSNSLDILNTLPVLPDMGYVQEHRSSPASILATQREISLFIWLAFLIGLYTDQRKKVGVTLHNEWFYFCKYISFNNTSFHHCQPIRIRKHRNTGWIIFPHVGQYTSKSIKQSVAAGYSQHYVQMPLLYFQ